MTEFKCKMCEQSNKKIHGEERGGGSMSLDKNFRKGDYCPRKGISDKLWDFDLRKDS